MKFTYHARTDTGLVRALNEDSVRIVRPEDKTLQETRGDLLVVADGMGGHQSGEVASEQTVETISERYYKLPGSPAAALVEAIQEANDEVFRRARAEDRPGMGTTVVAAARVADKLYIAHVGDSRLYLIRDRQIRPLTEDHSLVAEQVAAGLLTPEQAEHHPHRNVISRAVGTSPELEVELSAISPLQLEQGDIILLCSDGLTEHVKPPRILQLVQNRTPEKATQALVDAANSAGGTDNISVIVARVGEMPNRDAATKPLPTVASGDDPDRPTEPLPTASDGGPISPSTSASTHSSGFSALLGIVASLLVLALLGGVGWLAWSTTAMEEQDVDTTTDPPPNNLLVPHGTDGTPLPVETTTNEPGIAPLSTNTRSPLRTGTPQATLSPSPTATTEPSVTSTPITPTQIPTNTSGLAPSSP
ncbi:MAG: Stp1/IreP family PP2C-type Ser/Thr phosphatase [Chloroflexota bacterium]|nr:Stp1/IreP family PP2C-type Ser/Thr phosphatase [Chloroflexota bacterium]